MILNPLSWFHIEPEQHARWLIALVLGTVSELLILCFVFLSCGNQGGGFAGIFCLVYLLPGVLLVLLITLGSAAFLDRFSEHTFTPSLFPSGPPLFLLFVGYAITAILNILFISLILFGISRLARYIARRNGKSDDQQ